VPASGKVSVCGIDGEGELRPVKRVKPGGAVLQSVIQGVGRVAREPLRERYPVRTLIYCPSDILFNHSGHVVT